MTTDAQISTGYQSRKERRRTLTLVFVALVCFVLVIGLSRWMDEHKPRVDSQIEEERLYLTGKTLKRMSLGFNGFVADWYWMRSLQYVGHKILDNPEKVQLDDLGPLDMRLLYPLLDTATTLDPKFLPAYSYGAIVLPAINEDDAIKLARKGLEQNPNAWQLYQHLGYIYWKRGDYKQASENYGAGANIPGAPSWLREMSARMSAEGGAPGLARDIYRRMYEQTDDKNLKELMLRRLMQVDSFEERDAIRVALKAFRERKGRCASDWHEMSEELRTARLPDGKSLRFDSSGAPLDPSDTPYVLNVDTCDVDVSLQSRVPYR
jgi:tetratricopeptide (TPR) repeat protein